MTLLGRAAVVESEAAIRDAAARINPKYAGDPSAWAGNVLVRIEPGTVTHSTY